MEVKFYFTEAFMKKSTLTFISALIVSAVILSCSDSGSSSSENLSNSLSGTENTGTQPGSVPSPSENIFAGKSFLRKDDESDDDHKAERITFTGTTYEITESNGNIEEEGSYSYSNGTLTMTPEKVMEDFYDTEKLLTKEEALKETDIALYVDLLFSPDIYAVTQKADGTLLINATNIEGYYEEVDEFGKDDEFVYIQFSPVKYAHIYNDKTGFYQSSHFSENTITFVYNNKIDREKTMEATYTVSENTVTVKFGEPVSKTVTVPKETITYILKEAD